MSTGQETSFFCNMGAIAPADRRQHIAITREVFGAVQEIRELPNGYAFGLPDDTRLLLGAAEFIANERLCCPFFSFTVEVAPTGSLFWLYITGSDLIKPFIRAEIGETLNEVVARTANFH